MSSKRPYGRRMPSWRTLALLIVGVGLGIAGSVLYAGLPGVGGADRREVSRLINHYFETWSAADMEGYGACFSPEASIYLLRRDGEMRHYDLRAFLRTQRMAHAVADGPMTERAVRCELWGSDLVYQANVRWRLEADSRVQEGHDFFTIARREGRWRIVSLVFHADP